MEKCPCCQDEPIDFFEWGQGLNAFRTHCRSCGVALKATTRTYYATTIAVVAVLSGVLAVAMAVEDNGIAGVRILVVPLVAIGVCVIAYQYCGYEEE